MSASSSARLALNILLGWLAWRFREATRKKPPLPHRRAKMPKTTTRCSQKASATQQTSMTTPKASRKAAPIALAHSDMRRNFSSSSSVTRSSARVLPIAISVATRFFRAAKRPSRPSSSPAACDMRLATADQDAQSQAQCGGDTNGLPRLLMHEIVSGPGSRLGLVDNSRFQIKHALLGIAQTNAETLAQFAHLLAGRSRRSTQHFFRIGNDT